MSDFTYCLHEGPFLATSGVLSNVRGIKEDDGNRRLTREERKERRRQRVEARKKLFRIGLDVYEDGDTVDDLRDKITERLEGENLDRPFLAFLLKMLELILPLLLGGLI
jgi:hypothetical protein